MSPTPFPRLDAPRLWLRAFAPADVPVIATLANDYEVARNTLNIPHPYHEEDARQWVRQARENFQRKVACAFALELRATGEFVGGIGLNLEPRFDRAEAGYWLGRPHWGRGLATEALGALLRFGFEELKLNKIYATHFTENPASGRVMLKNGMVKEGELAQHAKRDGQYHDLWQYRLLRAEYVGLAPKHGST